jgi:hypothetical protein
LIVEDRLPGGAGVLGLPHATRADRHVPHAAVLGVDGDIRDASAVDRGSDVAERESLVVRRPEARVTFLSHERLTRYCERAHQQHGTEDVLVHGFLGLRGGK